jgi:hypothetical protein
VLPVCGLTGWVNRRRRPNAGGAAGSRTADIGRNDRESLPVQAKARDQFSRKQRGGFEFWSDPDVSRGTAGLQTPRRREMDSNFRFRASSDYAGVGVLRSTWAVLTLRRRDPDWNATKRRRDSERRASTAAE